jgi:hypothetical protein
MCDCNIRNIKKNSYKVLPVLSLACREDQGRDERNVSYLM